MAGFTASANVDEWQTLSMRERVDLLFWLLGLLWVYFVVVDVVGVILVRLDRKSEKAMLTFCVAQYFRSCLNAAIDEARCLTCILTHLTGLWNDE